jgi:adenylylsulfate kinase
MGLETQKQVVWHHATVTRDRRQQLNGHKSFVLWFTGFSGSGKSTIAHAVEEELHAAGMRTFVFDGDNVRHGLCADLGFSERDRSENLRRIGEMGKLFLEAGVIALTAFISPLRADRERIRSMYQPGEFFEIFIDCPLEVCEQRDVKGMYKRARAGEIKQFTGISAPYEPPHAPDLTLRSNSLSLEECVSRVVALVSGVSQPGSRDQGHV